MPTEPNNHGGHPAEDDDIFIAGGDIIKKLIIVLFSASIVGCASVTEPTATMLGGTYHGTIRVNGNPTPVTTELIVSGAQVGGSYSYGRATGAFSECSFIAPQLSCLWREGRITGGFRVEFAADFKSFTGAWDFTGGQPGGSWTGSRLIGEEHINSSEEPNPVKPDGTYTDKNWGTEEVWVGGKRVAYAEQTYWSNGELRSDNRWDAEKDAVTYFYESGMKEAEHRAEPRGADAQNTGWWGYWYENGQQKYALNLVNGKREGAQAYWYENGQEMLTGNYVGDLPDGPLSEWDANGKETRLCRGNGVTLNGDCAKEGLATLWHENGQKMAELNVVNDKKEGLATLWHENGQKEQEGNYVNDNPEGIWTWWYENGQKKSEGNYVNGKSEGVWNQWHENGQKKPESNYINGVKQ
jgi:antitoxin component YwqK of YwqJK toxin-antitoxin module